MNDASPFVLQFLNSTLSFTSIDFWTQNQLFHGSESTVLVSKAQITTISPDHLVVSNSATFSFKLCAFSISSPNSVTTGLLKTEYNWSGLQVISSRVTNVTMSHESCLTGDALTRSVQMISSQVLNLSTTTPTTAFSAAPSISAHGTSLVVGSDWVDTSNAFYGQIVGDLNSHSNMFFINNTHIRSIRTEWYSPSNAVITSREVLTASKTCTGDTFNGCHHVNTDASTQGGAFYVETNYLSISLTSCTFIACYADLGGAIRVTNKCRNDVTIDQCTFDGCYATDQTGAYRSHNFGPDTITNCKFNSCTGPQNGCLFFIYSSQVEVSGCTFTACTATTGTCSAIETITSTMLNVLVSNSSIINCDSKICPQMMFVDNCKFQSLVFHQCTTDNPEYGDVRGGAKHSDIPSYSSDHMPHFNTETAELDQTINFPPWKVTDLGVDENLCGFYDRKCLSVAYVLSLCIAKNKARTAYAMQVITLLDATHIIPAVPLGDQAITIQGLKTGSSFNTQFTSSDQAATFLSVTTGRFFVKDLHLLALSGGVFLEVAGTGQGKVTGCKMDTTTTGTMSTAFATLATGTLTIETSTFTGLTLSATALISATSGKLSIASSEFSQLSLVQNGVVTTSGTSVTVTDSHFSSNRNQNGDGGALSLTLGTANSLTVKTSSFKLDSATGRGGAVFVSTTSTVAQSDAVAPFLTYGWNDEVCSATLGENVLVSCSSVSTELASRKWTTLKPALPERNLITAERETFKIVDGTSSEKLLYHWYPHTSGEVHLHSVGEDHTNCGILQLACVTMETAMTNMKTMKVVLIDSAFVRSTDFQSTAATWTLRQSSGCSLTLQGDGQIQIASGANSALTLDTLTLGVGTLTSGRSTSLFSVAAGSLTFSNCQLTIPSTIPATLHPITITGGTLIITSGTVTLPTTLSSTLVKASAGTTTISEITFANSALSESLISGTGTLSVRNCSFSDLTSKSAISFTVGASQTLSIGESGKTTTFSDCSSSTDGGAICCFVKETGTLVVVSTSFSGCSSSGNGGSIFLSLTSTNSAQRTWDFDLRGASFSTDSAAKGAAVYVSGSFFETAITTSLFPSVSSSTTPTLFWGTDSKSTVSSSLLVYLVEIGNVVSVGGSNSHDIVDCGHFGVPCLTIGKGLERAIASSNTIQIKVHANSALKSSYSVASSLSVSIVGDVQTSNGYLTVSTVSSDTLIASVGSLSISQLAFTGTSDRSVSFLQLHSGASLSLTSCEFSGFISSVAGSIVSGTSSISNGLTLSDVAFSSCSSSLDGGVIVVTVSSSASLALSGSISFSDCSSGTSNGQKIHLTSSDLIAVLSDSGTGGILDSILPSVGSTGIFTSAEKNEFWGVETKEDGSSGSLLFFRHPHTTGAVHLHVDGEDHLHCGDTTLPCQSLAHSLSSMKSEKEVRLDSSLTLTAALMSSHVVWTLSASSTGSLSLTQNAQISLTASPTSTVTFSSLPLTAGSLTVDRSASLFSVAAGTLILSNCRLTLPSSIPSTMKFITVSSAGVFEMNSGTMSLPSSLKTSLISSNAGSVTLSVLSFSNSILSEAFITGTGTMSVKNCSFSALTSKSTISFTVGGSQTLSIGESGKTTTFSGCSSSTDGGAICCSVKETGTLVVVSTSFSGCSSSGNGGSIFLSLTSTNNAQRTWDFDLSDASIIPGTATLGSAVYVSGSYFETSITHDLFPSVVSSTDTELFWGRDSNSSVRSSLLVYLVEIENVVSVGGPNAFEIDDCGHFGVPCVSIGKGLLRVVPPSNSVRIEVHANSPLKSSYSVASSLSVSIVGDVQTSNGYLTVSTVSSDTLIASTGSLSISQLAFTGTTDRSVSLFQLSSGGSLSLTSCSFSGFSSSVAGSVVSGTSSVVDGLTLTNVDFSRCSSSLDGGVIAVTVSSATSLTLSGSVSFLDCSCGTTNGNKIHLTSSDLISVLANSGSNGILDSILPSVGSTGIFTSAEKNEFWGVETKEDGSSGSLLFFRHPHTTGAVHLHVDGEDHLHCGDTTLPCQSLAHSLSSMKSEKEVRLDSSLTLTAALMSSHVVWTLSASSTGSLSLTLNAQISLTASPTSTVTFSSLPITVGTITSGRTTPMFSVESGSLILSNCGLTFPTTIPATLNPITITGGTLIITTGTVTLPTALSKSFLSSTAGTTTISEVAFANSALSESLISGTGTMSVKNCSFSALTSKSTISFTVGASQILSIGESGKTTTFSGCSSSTDGGAICCFVKETGKLVVVSTSFSGCSSSGNGGSIFLSLTSANTAQRTWDFDLRGASFTTDSAAKGAAVYVSGSFFETAITTSRFPSVSSSTPDTLFWGSDENSTVSSSLLVYLLPISNIVTVGGTGAVDIDDCGHFGVNCASLPHSHGRIRESLPSTLVISVVDDLTMSGEVAHNVDKALSIEGTAPFSISLDSSAHFVITKGSLAFSNISFALSSPLSNPLFEITSSELSLDATTAFATTSAISFSRPLFLLNSDHLSLEQTTFSFVGTLTLTGTSLIVVNDGSLVIDACSIANVHSSSEGSVVNAHVTESGSLSVSQCTFSHCTSDGSGGVLQISCDEGVTSSSLLVNSTFDASCTCGASGKGEWVYVEGHDFVSLITPLNWKLTSTSLQSPLNDNLLSGEDLAEEVEDVNYRHITLLYFLLFFSNETIYSGANGRDAAGCGQMDRPCDTLAIAHTHLRNVDQDTLVVVESSELTNTMELGVEDFKLTRKSGETTVSVVVKENGMILNEHATSTSHSISIDHLVFNLSAATCSSFIKSNNGELSIASSSFEASLPIAFILLDLEGGQTTLSQTTILVSTTTGSLFKVSTGKLTVGSLLLTGLTFASPAIILNNGATASFTILELTDTETSTLITASNSTLELIFSKLIGKTSSAPSLNSEELCEWGTGFVILDNCTTEFSSTSFSFFAQGALLVSNGNVTLTMSSFSDNTPGHSVFTSARRNVECSGNGKIVIPSLGGGDGSSDKLPSAWMALKDECVVESTIVEEYEAMFVAKLNTAKSNATHHRNKTFSVMLVGDLFIPCGLGLEIYGILNNTQTEPVVLPFTSLTPSVWNETQINITLNETELNKRLDPEAAWHARIVFGKGGCTDSIQLKLTGAEKRQAETAEAMKWLLPLIIALITLLVIIIFVVIVCCIRKNRKEKDEPIVDKEIDDQEFEMEIKMAEVDPPNAQTLGTTAFVFEENAPIQSKLPPSTDIDGQEHGAIPDEECELVSVIGANGVEVPMFIRRKDTLFNRLHKTTDPLPLDVKAVQARVVKGVATLAAKGTFDILMRKLSPHCVQLIQNDEVVFRMDNGSATGKGGNEVTRWQAPETRTEQLDPNTAALTQSTPSQAAVFSLGLILQEIETGTIPFGELDAQNAQRQLGNGLAPPMIGIEDEEFIEMIHRCLNVSPDERPKFKELDEFFTQRNVNDKSAFSQLNPEQHRAPQPDRQNEHFNPNSDTVF